MDAIENHIKVKFVRGSGLFLEFEPEGSDAVEQVINKGVELGFISDTLLLDNTCFHIAPPLTITNDEILQSIGLVRKALGGL